MQTFYQILGILGAAMIVFVLFRMIKGNPQQFSKEHLNKSFLTMGVLAVGLIAFVTLLIWMVKHT